MLSHHIFLLNEEYFLNIMINAEFGKKGKKPTQNPHPSPNNTLPPKPLLTLKVSLQPCRNGKRTTYWQKFQNLVWIFFLYNHVWTLSKAKASDICNLSMWAFMSSKYYFLCIECQRWWSARNYIFHILIIQLSFSYT